MVLNKKLSKLIIVFIAFFAFGCKRQNQIVTAPAADEQNSAVKKALEQRKTSFKSGILRGMSCVPFCYFLENDIKDENINFSQELYSSKEDLLTALLKGQIQSGVFTAQEAAKINLLEKDSVVIAGFLMNSSAIFITSDSQVSAIDEVNDCLFVPGGDGWLTGAARNLYGENILIDTSVAAADFCTQFSTQKIKNALIDQPYASIILSKNPRLINCGPVFEDYGEYVVVVNAAFSEKNKEAVNRFIEYMGDACFWIKTNREKTKLSAVQNNLLVSDIGMDKAFEADVWQWKSGENAKNEFLKSSQLFKFEMMEDGFFF